MSKLQQNSASRCIIDKCPGYNRTLLDGVQLIKCPGYNRTLLDSVKIGKYPGYNRNLLKALVFKNSDLHDFGFRKVSPAKQL